MFEIFALVAVGLSSAGGLWAAFRTLKRRPPRYLLPLVGGVSMMAFHVWNGYSWHTRTQDLLPQGVEVVQELTERVGYEPWTFLFPRVNGFVAVDLAGAWRRDDQPGFVLVNSYLVKRREPTVTATQMFDCARARWTSMSDSTKLNEDGMPLDSEWIPATVSDPMFDRVCAQNAG